MSNEQVLTLEEHLASFVDICDEYKQLYAAWTTGKRNLIKILSNVSLVFPHYSLHDDSHAQSILRNIERILGTERIKTLKPTEVWLLLMSAYSHDIGMLVKHKELCEVWSSSEFDEYLNDIMSNPKQSELKDYAKYFKDENFKMEMLSDVPVQLKWAVIILSADYFRKKHADMGYRIITDMDNYGLDFKIDFSFNKFIPERVIYLLGEIAKLHGRTFDDVKKLNFCTNGIGLSDDYVYPRRIAELIRLGDLLDLDNGRFNENTYKLFGDIPETTLANREKHKAIRHFLVCDNCIEVTANCPDENSYQAVRDWFDWLHDEIQNLSLHWHEIMPENFGAAPPLPKLKIFLHGIELKGNSLLKFDFKTEHIFELLEGANIYKNSYAFFRELIQNSIDASKLHLWTLICNGTYKINKTCANYIPLDIPSELFDLFKIEIFIEYNKSRNGYEISIHDKGIGFTEQTLENMQNIARSWQDRCEWKQIIKNMPAWLRPTGGFGLGLQSVFKVTDVIECVTKSIDCIKKRIKFRSRKKDGRISYEIIDSSFNDPIETKISFFIPFSETAIHSYLGNKIFDVAIHEFNPFEKSDDYNIPYLRLINMIDHIREEVYDSLFPIEIHCNVDDIEENIKIDRTFSISFDKNSMKDTNNNYIVHIDLLKYEIALYDIQHDISIQIHFIKTLGYRGQMNLIFKGMHIDESFLRYIELDLDEYISLVVELNGFDSREYITLNREKLRNEKHEEIEKYIVEGLNYAFKSLFEEIDNKKEDAIKLSQDFLLELCGVYEKFFMYGSLNLNYNSIYDLLTKRLSLKAEEYIRSSSNEDFHLEKVDIKNIIETYHNGKYFFLLIEEENNRFRNNGIENDDDIQSLKTFSNILDGTNIVLIKNVNYFLTIRHINKIFMDLPSDRHNYFLLQCSNKFDEDNLFVTIDDKVKEYIYIKLCSNPHMTTIAFKGYETLAVNYTHKVLNMSHRFALPSALYLMRYTHNVAYLISPFNVDDINKIQNVEISDENIWNCLSKRNDFKNLIKHVKLNNISSNVTEIDIRNTYEVFVKEIIKIVRIKNNITIF